MSSPAQSSEAVLQWLFDESLIRLCPSPLLASTPLVATPATADRISGMMLGLAIGDALGNTSESMLPVERRQLHGEIRDYLPNPHAENRRVGLPSDDSQLAFWTLEHLLEQGGLQIESLADRFCRGRIFGLGRTMRGFLQNRRGCIDWFRCGPESAGNGALMRIAPILIPHLEKPSPQLWSDTVLAAMLTHNDFASTSSCVAFVAMLWELLQAPAPPAMEWWLNRYIALARPLQGSADYQPRGGNFLTFRKPLWKFIDGPVRDATKDQQPCAVACQSWHSGAYLMETVPSVLYILSQWGHDPEEAIVHAVNDTHDNDTVAAIVGAAVGALHGQSGLPARWIIALSGRTAEADEGRMFELLDTALARFITRN